jgi:hypothetical protein
MVKVINRFNPFVAFPRLGKIARRSMVVGSAFVATGCANSYGYYPYPYGWGGGWGGRFVAPRAYFNWQGGGHGRRGDNVPPQGPHAPDAKPAVRVAVAPASPAG